MTTSATSVADTLKRLTLESSPHGLAAYTDISVLRVKRGH